MYVFHVTARVVPGREAEYEDWKSEEGVSQRAAPGFIKRLLLRDQEEAGVYHYISFWDSEEQCYAFAAKPEFKALHARHDPAATFSQPMLRHACDVLFDEVADALPLGGAR